MIELGKKTTVVVDIPVTAENLQAYVLDKDQSIKKYDIIQGITKAHLIEYYNSGEEVNNFLGAVELTQAEAEGLVPDTFPNSSQAKMFDEVVYDEENETSYNVQSAHVDENDNVIMEQVNWIEYCGLIHNRQKFLPNSINAKLLCGIGRRDKNGHKKVTSNDEFRLFAGNFGIENILTKSEAAILDQRTAIITFRGTITPEAIDEMTHADLNALSVNIELMTGLDLVISSLNLEPKKTYIKNVLGWGI